MLGLISIVAPCPLASVILLLPRHRRDASSVRKARVRDHEVRRKMRRQMNGASGAEYEHAGTSSADEYDTNDNSKLDGQIGMAP